ncbi:hypothetical protein ACILD6_02405 [Capnocytophaga canimorsus]
MFGRIIKSMMTVLVIGFDYAQPDKNTLFLKISYFLHHFPMFHVKH